MKMGDEADLKVGVAGIRTIKNGHCAHTTCQFNGSCDRIFL